MAKKFDVVAVTGKYTDASGTEKKRYTNIGVVFESDKGMSIKLESIPVGWDGWANFYEPKGREDRPAATQPEKPAAAGDDPFRDEVPF